MTIEVGSLVCRTVETRMRPKSGKTIEKVVIGDIDVDGTLRSKRWRRLRKEAADPQGRPCPCSALGASGGQPQHDRRHRPFPGTMLIQNHQRTA